MLLLSAEDIAALAIPPRYVRQAVEAAYAAATQGVIVAPPKLALDLGGGRSVQAVAAAWPDSGFAALKWVSVVPPGAGPTVRASILITCLATGDLVACLDAGWVTAVRTAAMTALAARRLADPATRSIAFVGCGVQAYAHLDALREVLPGVAEVRAVSRSRDSALRLALHAEWLGLAALVETDPGQAVRGADLVVTSVPAAADLDPFIEPAWFAPTAFVAAVDLGRSIRPHGLERFACLATDDRHQSEALGRAGKLVSGGPFAFDLADLCSPLPPIDQPAGPTLFAFAGHGLADLAVATLVVEEARRRGIGRELPWEGSEPAFGPGTNVVSHCDR